MSDLDRLGRPIEPQAVTPPFPPVVVEEPAAAEAVPVELDPAAIIYVDPAGMQRPARIVSKAEDGKHVIEYRNAAGDMVRLADQAEKEATGQTGGFISFLSK